MVESKKRVQLKVGDIFEIPLSDGTYAYGQYYVGDKSGHIIRIFNYRGRNKITPEKAVTYPLLFPPIHVGIRSPFRDGPSEKLWKKIGHIPITDFVTPIFRSAIPISPGKYGKWYIVQGDKVEEVGFKLPEKYKKLEQSGVWPADWVNERIENGGKLPERLKWMGES